MLPFSPAKRENARKSQQVEQHLEGDLIEI